MTGSMALNAHHESQVQTSLGATLKIELPSWMRELGKVGGKPLTIHRKLREGIPNVRPNRHP